MNVDLTLHARWIIPVQPRGSVLEHHALGVKDGRIVAVLPSDQARATLEPREEIVLDDHALIPGLVNAHTHAAMTLFRGYADDLALMTWLQEHIWPAEARWVSPEFVRVGTELAVAEMIRGGTTCFNDMYFFPTATAEVAESRGIRACVGLIVLDFPTPFAASAEEYFDKGMEAYAQLRDRELVTTVLAPHAPYTVSDEPLQRVGQLAQDREMKIHMHVHESAGEIAQAMEQGGERPLARLARLGLVSDRLVAVHMTQITEEDLALAAEGKISVVHCPESNLKLASGLCPVKRLLDAGVTIALGTDGAASNNDLDLLGELKTAALLAKAVAEDAAAVPAATALELATLGGARALGLDRELGSLEPGKAADVVAVDLSCVEAIPLYNPISQLVYAGSREQVSDVWIAGKAVLREKKLQTIDELELRRQVAEWRDRLVH